MNKLTTLLIVGQAAATLALEPAFDARSLVAETGIGNGLCIAMGLDLPAAKALLADSRLYVQLVAPDDKTALEWLRAFESGKERAGVSVVSHKPDPLPYSRNVANLIVVKGGANCPPAAEINRVLTPGGAAVIFGAPAAFAGQAGKLGLTRENSASALILRKPKLPASEDWGNLSGGPELGNSLPNSTIEPSMSLRWRAGPRWQARDNNDDALVCGGGVLVYRQIEVVPGSVEQFQQVLIARDAYNGRELWRHVGQPINHPRYGFSFTPLMAVGEGRICGELDGKLTCLDAASGRKLFTPELAKPARTAELYRKYLIFSGDGALSVHALADGKKLWTKSLPGKAVVRPIKGETIFLPLDNKIAACRLDTGAELWSVPTGKDERPELEFRGRIFCTGAAVHYTKSSKEKTFIFALDQKTGKALWTSEVDNPQTVFPGFKDISESLSLVAFDDEIWGYFNKRAVDRGYTVHLTCLDARTGEVRKKNYSMHNGSTHCWGFKGAGNYLLYSKNQFVDRRDMKETVNGLVRSVCGVGHIPAAQQLFMLPHNCRCGTLIRGVLAMGAPEKAYDFENYAAPAPVVMGGRYTTQADSPGDWPMYRGTAQRSSSCKSGAGAVLKKKWETSVGGEGLSQAVSAYGMVVLSDSEGQRIVALDSENGAIKWNFPTGSRVSYPPALYKGLCLFGTVGGWVWALDARSGAPVWKLRAAPDDCFMGSQDRFESRWPVVGDVLVQNGVGYVNAGRAGTIDGGVQVVAFDPATGKVAWNKAFTNAVSADLLVGKPSGDGFMINAKLVITASKTMSNTSAEPPGCLNIVLRSIGGVGSYSALDDYLSSSARHQISARREKLGDMRIAGINVAFSDKLSIATLLVPRKEVKDLLAPEQRLAAADAPKKIKWDLPAAGMRVDGLVLASDTIYWVGGSPTDDPKVESTLQAWSAADGKCLNSVAFGERAIPDGLSIANGNAIIVTRSGKVLCYGGQAK